MTKPFLTFYTPTFRRPQALARCLASVGRQTIADEIEQIVIPDHVGRGVAGMYATVPQYADAVHGTYVHLLADDDVLAEPDVVARVKAFAEARQFPPLILVYVNKGGNEWPAGAPWPPVCGAIDLGCFVVRADVWKAHVSNYGRRYEGDYDFAAALHAAGITAAMCELLFLHGAVMRGAPEMAA